MEYMHGAVRRSGDTMTGDLIINKPFAAVESTAGNIIIIDGKAGVDLRYNGVTRFYVGVASGYTNLVGINPTNAVFFLVQAPTATAPEWVEGGEYYDTTLHKKRVGGVAGWETVTSV